MTRFLRQVERRVSPIDRCRPINAREQFALTLASWKAGQPRCPRFTYGPAADLGALRRSLAAASEVASSWGALGSLYVERACELDAEAAIAENVATAGLSRCATSRYACRGAEAEVAARWAASWLEQPPPASQVVYRSDDWGEPRSLVCALARALGELRLPFRPSVDDRLAAAAATGDGWIGVAPGRYHSERDGLRIALHEVRGHAQPRVAAAHERWGIFAVATRGGQDHEEGRALWLERQAGLMGPRRRFELGLRHQTALAMRAGAGFVECASAALARGASVELAVTVACRAFRGGLVGGVTAGLGRECIYLPALARVAAAFERDPDSERWLERGRVAVDAIPVLASVGV